MKRRGFLGCGALASAASLLPAAPVLVRLAFAYEQASGHRRPPQFLPTVERTRA